MIIDFNSMPEDARIWIYGSDMELSLDDQNSITDILEVYLENWEYHKNPIKSSVTILENHFIIIALDEKISQIGGCSIDELHRVMQTIEERFSISLFNRLNVFCKIKDVIKCFPVKTLKEVANLDTLFFDLTIQKKMEIETFLKPIQNGWCSRYI